MSHVAKYNLYISLNLFLPNDDKSCLQIYYKNSETTSVDPDQTAPVVAVWSGSNAEINLRS